MARTERSTNSPIKHIAIVGSGKMGTQIAQAYVEAGLRVTLIDNVPGKAEQAEKIIYANLQQMNSETLPKIRLDVAESLENLGDVDLVQEAVPEDLSLKEELFIKMDRILPEDTILATNTSSFKISEIASNCQFKERVLGVHWVSPAYLIPTVEVIYFEKTDKQVIDTVKGFLLSIGKKPVVCKELPGFLINRLQLLLQNEAAYLLEAGYATKEDIDNAFRWALGPRLALWGLFRTDDLVVNKRTTYSAFNYMYQVSGDPRFRPSRVLEAAIENGKLGATEGEGYYSYRGLSPETISNHRDRALQDILVYLKNVDEDAFWESDGD